MGLQSALTTSLTGMKAAETTIDVVGNNVANASTVGFKASHVLFATQFLQTQSIGSAPTDTTGGTNPRQTGLGVKVAAINPDFSQGTIQISSNPLDVAIQGDGFLIVEGSQGEQLYTRNGQFQTNSLNEIVTATGNRVLGNVADDNFNVAFNTESLVPITIPFGVPVSEETHAAFFRGDLSPLADVGTSGVLTSQALGDYTFEVPSASFGNTDFHVEDEPDVSGTTATPQAGGSLTVGNHLYKVVWFTSDAGAGGALSESPASIAIDAAADATNKTVQLDNLPLDNTTTVWSGRRIYRSDDDGATYQQVGADITDVDTTTTFTDDGTLPLGSAITEFPVLDQQEYSYYVTFRRPDGVESRPTPLIGPFSIDNASRRVVIQNLPQPTGDDGFDQIAIYRNRGDAPTEFKRVGLVGANPANRTFIDAMSDDDLALVTDGLDLLGAKASPTTLLTDVVLRDGDTYTRPFKLGTLSFVGTRGGQDLEAKQLVIDATTNVGDLRAFMQQAFGIDTAHDSAGVSLNSDGELVTTSNAGVANQLGVNIGAFTMAADDPLIGTTSLTFDFDQTIAAEGQGTSTGFVVFDTLGNPVNVRVTTVRIPPDPGSNNTFYRWYATSEDNILTGSVGTFLASGDLEFNLQGSLIDPLDGTAQISVNHPAGTQLTFDLDFNSVSGLSVTDSQGNPVSTMALTRQDGFPTGTLTTFTVTESGLIRGVFSNGAERPLGQLLMATFANNTGLQQVGSNMYARGINSGEPQVNLPGFEGNGTLTAGAVELSNADIGQNLIDLILASTQYRGGARVITTTQQLFDELLNIRR